MRQVDPRLVVVGADLAQPLLPGVLEPAGVGRAGLAVFVVGVDADQRAVDVGDRDHASALVGRIEAVEARARPVAGVFHHRLAGRRIEHVALQHIARSVIFGDGVPAVVGELRRRRAAHLRQPQQRIVSEADPARTRGQQVFG